ncbi:PhzF family phenazine biosynthesis protein [Micromonospora soli]|uniref:PhzF family phenazine biosynthesis protein n=1 Tax=Micromonospora sp. NBRC 110009 TaxID=3061627 RepID=UPI0026712AD5|nr:PhzF family phenazine biosynthesis protein [Micromonospora sp. NBRC 110009]WKU02025.1 PhzF family phenazine biosynthesis protein [Micromonospora sp. NBRC 110009]
MTTNGSRLFVVDAFTDEPFRGNPAGVVILDEKRDEAWMQAVASEMRHSETAFALPADGGWWHLRWFTPTVEVDLCGHATLATAHVLGGHSRFRTRSGDLTCTVSPEGWIEMDFPADPPTPVEAPPGLDRALGADVTVVAVARGVSDLLVEVAGPPDVRAVRPDLAALASIPVRGVIVTAYDDDRDVVVSRCFYPAVGVPEDPVTGSAHCTIGSWWAERRQRDDLRAEQLSPRGGTLRLSRRGDRMRLAGRAVTVWRGEMSV